MQRQEQLFSRALCLTVTATAHLAANTSLASLVGYNDHGATLWCLSICVYQITRLIIGTFCRQMIWSVDWWAWDILRYNCYFELETLIAILVACETASMLVWLTTVRSRPFKADRRRAVVLFSPVTGSIERIYQERKTKPANYSLFRSVYFSWGWYLCARENLYVLHPSLKSSPNVAFETVPMLEDIPLVEFMYLVFIRMPGENHRRRLRSLLLCLCWVFRAPINSLVCCVPMFVWLTMAFHGRSSREVSLPRLSPPEEIGGVMSLALYSLAWNINVKNLRRRWLNKSLLSKFAY